MKSFKKSLFIAFKSLVVLILVLGLFFVTPWGRIFSKTVLIIPEIWPQAPLNPLRVLSREPIVEEIEFQSGNETIAADLYLPKVFDKKGGKYPLSILVLVGVDPESELVRNYAKGFSRLGMIILVPKVPGLSTSEIVLKDIQDKYLVDAFGYAKNLQSVAQDKMGFIGISYGGTLSLLAAAGSIRDSVSFVVVVSPYFDAKTSIAQIYNNVLIEDGKFTAWYPSAQNTKVTNNLLISSLAEQAEREILYQYEKGEVISEADSSKLSEEAQSIYRMIAFSKLDHTQIANAGENLEKFYGLYENLPSATLKSLNIMSLRERMKDVSAKVFILADGRDLWSPHTESVALAKILPDGQSDYVEVALLEHSQLTRRLPRLKTLKELFKLESFVFRVFAQIF